MENTNKSPGEGGGTLCSPLCTCGAEGSLHLTAACLLSSYSCRCYQGQTETKKENEIVGMCMWFLQLCSALCFEFVFLKSGVEYIQQWLRGVLCAENCCFCQKIREFSATFKLPRMLRAFSLQSPLSPKTWIFTQVSYPETSNFKADLFKVCALSGLSISWPHLFLCFFFWQGPFSVQVSPRWQTRGNARCLPLESRYTTCWDWTRMLLLMILKSHTGKVSSLGSATQ